MQSKNVLPLETSSLNLCIILKRSSLVSISGIKDEAESKTTMSAYLIAGESRTSVKVTSDLDSATVPNREKIVSWPEAKNEVIP